MKGAVVEWFRHGSAKAGTPVRIRSAPLSNSIINNLKQQKWQH